MTTDVVAPILLEDLLEDPDDVVDHVWRLGGYWNQARYVPPGTARSFTAGHPLVGPDATTAPPVFRSDWYRWGEVHGLGAQLATHPQLVDAARDVHEGDHVVPLQIHVNLTIPGPTTDAGHLDVPVFRGLDRRNAPGWLLLALARAGVADRWRVPVATAVVWLYRGDGGSFLWWDRDAQQRPASVDDLWNRAIVMDADRVLHAVDPIPGTAPSPTVDSWLDPDRERGGWLLRTADGDAGRLPVDAVRISLSWKAAVFEDHAARERYASGFDHLHLDRAVRLLRDAAIAAGADLDAHTVPAAGDPRFVAEIERTFPRPVPARARPEGVTT